MNLLRTTSFEFACLCIFLSLLGCRSLNLNYSSSAMDCGEDSKAFEGRYFIIYEPTGESRVDPAYLQAYAFSDKSTRNNIGQPIRVSKKSCVLVPSEIREDILIRATYKDRSWAAVVNSKQNDKAVLLSDYSGQAIDFKCSRFVRDLYTFFNQSISFEPSKSSPYIYDYAVSKDGKIVSGGSGRWETLLGLRQKLNGLIIEDGEYSFSFISDNLGQVVGSPNESKCDFAVDTAVPTIKFPKLEKSQKNGEFYRFLPGDEFHVKVEEKSDPSLFYCFSNQTKNSCLNDAEFSRYMGNDLRLNLPLSGKWTLHVFAVDALGNMSPKHLVQIHIFDEKSVELISSKAALALNQQDPRNVLPAAVDLIEVYREYEKLASVEEKLSVKGLLEALNVVGQGTKIKSAIELNSTFDLVADFTLNEKDYVLLRDRSPGGKPIILDPNDIYSYEVMDYQPQLISPYGTHGADFINQNTIVRIYQREGLSFINRSEIKLNSSCGFPKVYWTIHYLAISCVDSINVILLANGARLDFEKAHPDQRRLLGSVDEINPNTLLFCWQGESWIYQSKSSNQRLFKLLQGCLRYAGLSSNRTNAILWQVRSNQAYSWSEVAGLIPINAVIKDDLKAIEKNSLTIADLSGVVGLPQKGLQKIGASRWLGLGENIFLVFEDKGDNIEVYPVAIPKLATAPTLAIQDWTVDSNGSALYLYWGGNISQFYLMPGFSHYSALKDLEVKATILVPSGLTCTKRNGLVPVLSGDSLFFIDSKPILVNQKLPQGGGGRFVTRLNKTSFLLDRNQTLYTFDYTTGKVELFLKGVEPASYRTDCDVKRERCIAVGRNALYMVDFSGRVLLKKDYGDVLPSDGINYVPDFVVNDNQVLIYRGDKLYSWDLVENSVKEATDFIVQGPGRTGKMAALRFKEGLALIMSEATGITFFYQNDSIQQSVSVRTLFQGAREILSSSDSSLLLRLDNKIRLGALRRGQWQITDLEIEKSKQIIAAKWAQLPQGDALLVSTKVPFGGSLRPQVCLYNFQAERFEVSTCVDYRAGHQVADFGFTGALGFHVMVGSKIYAYDGKGSIFFESRIRQLEYTGSLISIIPENKLLVQDDDGIALVDLEIKNLVNSYCQELGSFSNKSRGLNTLCPAKP